MLTVKHAAKQSRIKSCIYDENHLFLDISGSDAGEKIVNAQ